MSIEYITDVRQEGKTTYVVNTNGRSLSVAYNEPYKSPYDDRQVQGSYKCNKVTIYDDMTVSSSGAHLAEIVLAVEVVRVIKDANQGDSK